MADAAHNYSRGDRAALILFGAGKCYWPACTEPLLKMVDGKYKIALEIAHIRAAKHDGERYVEEMTDAERAAFENVIFLCVAHHKTIDEKGAADNYSIEILEEWKMTREQGAPERLRGLREVTEDKLSQMIFAAFQERDNDVKQTLARLEGTDEEAAALLRELRDELAALNNSSRFSIDSDLVYMLSSAANSLRGIGDYAVTLSRAAQDLRGLEDKANILRDASSRFVNASDRAEQLRDTAERLNRAAARIEDAGGRFNRG